MTIWRDVGEAITEGVNERRGDQEAAQAGWLALRTSQERDALGDLVAESIADGFYVGYLCRG